MEAHTGNSHSTIFDGTTNVLLINICSIFYKSTVNFLDFYPGKQGFLFVLAATWCWDDCGYKAHMQ